MIKLKEKVDLYLGLGFRGFKVGAGYYDGESRSEVPANSVDAIVEMEASKADLLRAYVGPDIAILMDGHMGNPRAESGIWRPPARS